MATVKVSSIIRKLYVEANGVLVEVKQIDSVEDYAKGVTVYSKELVKGVHAGETTYAVAIADFVPRKRASGKDALKALLSRGLSAKELEAELRTLAGM